MCCTKPTSLTHEAPRIAARLTHVDREKFGVLKEEPDCGETGFLTLQSHHEDWGRVFKGPVRRI